MRMKGIDRLDGIGLIAARGAQQSQLWDEQDQRDGVQ